MLTLQYNINIRNNTNKFNYAITYVCWMFPDKTFKLVLLAICLGVQRRDTVITILTNQ